MLAGPRSLLLSAALLAGAPRASSQALGHLLYVTPAGRAISLKIIGGPQPGTLGLRAEAGESEAFRAFVLAQAGPVDRIARETLLLGEKAPRGWRVTSQGDRTLLKTPQAVFWQYAGAWILPVRFRFGGQSWELQSAQLPPLRFADPAFPRP